MSKRINFKQRLIKTVSPYLQQLGYELAERPESVGIGVFFYRKYLYEDIYSFVSFQLMRWHPPPVRAASVLRRFQVGLWRNRGPQPHYGHNDGENRYENWLYMPLGQLLWVTLDVKVYASQYHEWEFSTLEELETQLQDAVGKLIQYGIPWLEDPESENPYPSWP
jgi:hypothetical protein